MSNHLEHITRDGDRWDLLAWEFYGDALAYEGIIRANPSVPIYPILPAGLTLRIPILEDAPTSLALEELPPWKR